MSGSDVIVVGSGLLGATVARRLTEHGRHVLLVERGRTFEEPPGAHVRNGSELRDDPDAHFPTIDRYFDYLDIDAPPERLPGAFVTKIYGGISVTWTNNCPRPVAGVDRPELLEDEGWGLRFEAAERYLQVRNDQFDDSVRQREMTDRLGPSLTGKGRTLTNLPLSGHREDIEHIHYVAPADVLEPVCDDVDVLTGRVDEVVVDGWGASGVRVDGDTYEAADVVIAAGAVETPAVLWRSGLQPPALGRYLSFHPVLIAQLVLTSEFCAGPGEPDAVPRLGIPPTVERPWFTMLLRDTNPLPVDPNDGIDPNRLCEVQIFAPVDPHPDNRMTFDDEGVTGFDVPLRADDRVRSRAIERDAEELCHRVGRFRAGGEPAWAPFGTPHLMGSCRMGFADDGTSVADIDGRVWGTDNLYLATTGLIPNRLAVNPTLTAVALSLGAADAIEADSDSR